MLEVKNIKVLYDDFLAVDDLSFKAEEGRIFALLGLNGAGKTTTFRVILDLIKPNSGEVLFRGSQVSIDNSELVGFLSEERALMQRRKVLEQLRYFCGLKLMDKNQIDEKIDYWLDRLNITEYKNKVIKELSKGNQQKIQFISAIINEPKLLILDEPFTGLDPINVELFKDVIKELKSKGSTIIFSSHRMEHVEEFCENLLILSKGKTVISGNLLKIKEDFGSKNIFIRGTIDIDKIKKIDGVSEVETLANEYIVKTTSKDAISNVFKEVKKSDDITLFDVRLPSLNEIFVKKVGEQYE